MLLPKYIILEQKCHIMQDPVSTSHRTKGTKNKIRATTNNLEASQKQPARYLSFSQMQNVASLHK